MVRIGDVWDSTTDVLVGRAGMLLPIAFLTYFVPASVHAAILAYGDESVTRAVLAGLVALASLGLQLWGQLAIVAVASDPTTTRADAGAAATRRFGAGLLIVLVLLAAVIAALLPIGIAMAMSGFDWQAATAQAGSATAPRLAAGAVLFCLLYAMVLLVAALWLGARLFLVFPVVLNERRGIGAFGRSFQLTRGLALRLIGLSFLFVIVLLVSSWAARSVVFVVLRLLLGPDQIATATFMAALAVAAVQTALGVVAIVLATRLYAAVVGPKVVA